MASAKDKAGQFLQLCRDYALQVGLDKAIATMSSQKNVLDAVDGSGRNVLHLAAREGNSEIVALFLGWWIQ